MGLRFERYKFNCAFGKSLELALSEGLIRKVMRRGEAVCIITAKGKKYLAGLKKKGRKS